MKIGENIKRIRKEKGLRRSALVKKLKFIYGDNAIEYRTIERIEKGDIAKGRFSSLLQLADALDVDVAEFYRGTDYEYKHEQDEKLEDAYITRAKERGGIFRYNNKSYLEILSPEPSSYIVFLLNLDPKSKTKLEQDPQGTIKFLFVTEGEITVIVGTIERTLCKGDSIQINSFKPHYFENRTNKNASGILYQNPKNF